MSRLATPLRTELGQRTADALEAAHGATTVEDLLRCYPRRYASRGELTPLAVLRVGEQASVVAEVVSATARPMRARRGQLLEVVVTDGAGAPGAAGGGAAEAADGALFAPAAPAGPTTLRITSFLAHGGQAKHHLSQLRPGVRALFAGKVDSYQGRLQLVNPQYELLDDDAGDDEARARAAALIPIYAATAKVPTWTTRRAVAQVLDTLTEAEAPDPVPLHLRERHRLPGLLDAVLLAHRPTDVEQTRRARARFRYEEALVLQLALARRRAALSVLPASPYPRRAGGLLDRFDAALPFTLTAGQREVGEAVAADLARTRAMNRLLQGEVGSGKTVVALRAMLQVVDAGAQAALLAPTEVLAAQHHRSLLALLGGLGRGGHLDAVDGATRVVLLTGALPAAARREALLHIASGAAGVVVGTHALIQEAVEFADLGLAVVDEQHRFGVEQRDALRAKSGTPPHVLVMTATPIPRTVAMTVFGDLETSVLREVPPGRAGTTTAVVPLQRPAWVQRCWARVREEVLAGRQALVVCSRIGSDDDPAPALDGLEGPAGAGPDAGGGPSLGRSALEVLAELRERPETADLRLGLLHGRLPAEEKDAAMRAFAAGEVDVLVATTVVEVGVDVPNASTVVVVDAERYGLSQLHQLRGRVGRGAHPGWCLLLTGTDDEAKAERLRQVAETSDGFAVAELDLATRREGDVLGASQSGHRTSLRLLRVTRDADTIATARADALELVAVDPELHGQPALAAALAALDADREAYLDRA